MSGDLAVAELDARATETYDAWWAVWEQAYDRAGVFCPNVCPERYEASSDEHYAELVCAWEEGEAAARAALDVEAEAKARRTMEAAVCARDDVRPMPVPAPPLMFRRPDKKSWAGFVGRCPACNELLSRREPDLSTLTERCADVTWPWTEVLEEMRAEHKSRLFDGCGFPESLLGWGMQCQCGADLLALWVFCARPGQSLEHSGWPLVAPTSGNERYFIEVAADWAPSTWAVDRWRWADGLVADRHRIGPILRSAADEALPFMQRVAGVCFAVSDQWPVRGRAASSRAS